MALGVAPKLKGDALRAVLHRGSPLQIIACAGSGKTEVVSQRVADLIAGGAQPRSIVAFTFTERAADALKQRVQQRVEARLGKEALDRLGGCFIGTIHSYCFQLLREHLAKYESYDILDDNRLAAFLSREAGRIQLKSLNPRLFAAIKDFVRNLDVVDNELIVRSRLSGPFRDVIERFDQRLEAYRFLTYGRLIALAVEALKRPGVCAAVRGKLRHLIVDEYQDVNRAQEALISRLAGPPVELCVVGDDDQSIYQWRGSNVENIVSFARRYQGVSGFELFMNRRSRPAIIAAANDFAATIQGRLPKEMLPHRPGSESELVTWRAATEADEARIIAKTISRLVKAGFRYKDVAVLVRSASSYQRLLNAFTEERLPVQPGGRTGLFREPEAQAFGRCFAYLAGLGWRPEEHGSGAPVELGGLVSEFAVGFALDRRRRARVRDRLAGWKAEVDHPTRPANLIEAFYDLLGECGVADWDFSDPMSVARLGTLARCSAILADYESVRRRSRPDETTPGEIVGGTDRGRHYYFGLALHIQNWALAAFEGFEGEESFTMDAVDLTTIHKAKGLEWPIVFVPCCSAKRFPSSKTGQSQSWHVPDERFDRCRYEGTHNDERRLFYVAITRARDWLSVSTHDTPNKQRVAPSPFITRLAGGKLGSRRLLPLPPRSDSRRDAEDLLSVTVSELASFGGCGLAYRLRSLIGFQPSLSPELGYGRAVHHVLRHVAEYTRRHRRPPSAAQLNRIFDRDFYLPAATKPGHRQMKAAARRLVDRYVRDYGEDLARVWAIERPFELHLPNAIVTGRADVILDEADGHVSSLAIVDYKTANDENRAYERQLQIYADAGRREGMNVRAAYIHDLEVGNRVTVDVSAAATDEAEADAVSLVSRLRAREFSPNPGPACGACDVRKLCKHAVA